MGVEVLFDVSFSPWYLPCDFQFFALTSKFANIFASSNPSRPDYIFLGRPVVEGRCLITLGGRDRPPWRSWRTWQEAYTPVRSTQSQRDDLPRVRPHLKKKHLFL